MAPEHMVIETSQIENLEHGSKHLPKKDKKKNQGANVMTPQERLDNALAMTKEMGTEPPAMQKVMRYKHNGETYIDDAPSIAIEQCPYCQRNVFMQDKQLHLNVVHGGGQWH